MASSGKSSGSSVEIEKLATAIAEEVYVDVAKWHLYIEDIKDARLHLILAEQLFPLVAEGKVTAIALNQILANIPIVIGNGKQSIPLLQFIPASVEAILMDVLTRFEF
jgi:Protein of unknown function (DUF3181)